MTDGKILIEKLLLYAKTFLGLPALDEIYLRNVLLREFKLDSPAKDAGDISYVKDLELPDELIEEIKAYAAENGIAEEGTEADLFACYIFGVLTPRPSEVNRTFKSLMENVSAKDATSYLYNLSVKNYYVRMSAIRKNLKWDANELEIPLEITINLSKPEKNNKDIAKLLTAPKTGDKYPACALCKENEGFYGSLSHPPRSNIRTVSLTLGGEQWYMQYSPYLYFDEHCILLNSKHVPMKIDGNTIEKLFDFIEMFPHYFIGSNSDLPIVGGSILNHEHYQGGKHLMPLQKAKAFKSYKSDAYPDVNVDIVDFYNSTVRVYGFNRNTVEKLASDIIEKWKKYSDESVGIIAETDGVRHNTVTPIVRFLDDGRYCAELILRNNMTSADYPDGIFHAHPEYHNIKKEGIGLIEAMGLYILPARLKKQFEEMSLFLAGQKEYSYADICADETHPLYVHRFMIKEFEDKFGTFKTPESAYEKIVAYVDHVGAEILKNTAVFKKDAQGIAAFVNFLSTVNVR